MNTEIKTFQASTQYNDWIGTSALDSADIKGISNKFKDLIGNEHIVGVKVYMRTDTDPKKPIVATVKVYTGQVELDEFGNTRDGAIPELKEYEKDMPIEEFARLFKRIELKFSTKNILKTGEIKVRIE